MISSSCRIGPLRPHGLSMTLILLSLAAMQSCLPDPEIEPALAQPEWTYYTSKDGLGENFVKEIYEDKDGNLWFAHFEGGVTEFDGAEFTNHTDEDGLLSNTVNCVLHDHEETLIVGTGYGVNYRVKGSATWNSIGILEGVPVRTLIQTRDNEYWYGTEYYGILHVHDGVLDQIYDNACYDCNYIDDIIEAKDGTIWFATGGALKMYDGEEWHVYKVSEFELPHTILSSLHQDDWGNIWVASYLSKKITRYRDGNFELIDLMGFGNVTCMENGGPGELWIGVLGTGLLRYDGAIMRDIIKGPPDDGIAALLKDKTGAIWMGTFEKGVARYYPQ